ncbi:MAG: rhodanese-like domain-containing protein [Anaerolineae bacterium]
MRWAILGLLLVTALVAGCAPAAQTTEATPLPALVSPQDAVSMLEADSEDVVLLDVRTQQEWDIDGHAAQAMLIPLDQLPQRYTELDPNDTIIVVCRSGNRSQTASQFLREQGFSRVTEVERGMRNWVAQGLPVECAVETCALTQ